MTPVIALVGRPNVGKSTLFNKLTKTRDALVANLPGLTRDRKYGNGKVGDRQFIVIDTGGLTGQEVSMDESMARQTWQAVEEADALMFLVDGQAGITPEDKRIAEELRKHNKTIYLVVNKTDRINIETERGEFFEMGMGVPIMVAAAHNKGVRSLIDSVLDDYPDAPEHEEERIKDMPGTRIAIIGRPNVGKSTLINRLMGEERLVAEDQPGTTRDSIFIPFKSEEGKQYTLIDTAGVRRRGRVSDTVEKFSVVKTLQAIDKANVIVLVLDAHQGIADQDAHILGYALDAGRAIVIAINKWDGLSAYERERSKVMLERQLKFMTFAKQHFISALHGSGVGLLLESVDEAFDAAMTKISTSEMNRSLDEALMMHQPPMAAGRRIKLRMAHQGGSNPPIIVVHGNQLEKLPDSYTRYLENHFRKDFNLWGTPVRIEYKSSKNPFAGRKKKLSGDDERGRNLRKRKIMDKYKK